MSTSIYHKKSDHICEYGCNQSAHYHILPSWNAKNRKWCCSTHHQGCDNIQYQREKQSLLKHNKKHPNSSKMIKKKRAEQSLQMFGVSSTSHLPKVRQKIAKTNRDKFYDNLSNRNKNMVKPLFLKDEYLGVSIRHLWECVKCRTHFYDLMTHGRIPKCPKCFPLGEPSYGSQEWLDYLGVPNQRGVTREVSLLGKRVDGFDPETNTVYEYDGDKWHGNLELFDADEIFPKTGKTYQEHHNETQTRRQLFLDAGYKVIWIWESEWYKLKNILNTN